MADWYSDAFSSHVSASMPESGYRAPSGRQDGFCKVSALMGTTDMVSFDRLAMQPVNPRSRIRSLFLAWSPFAPTVGFVAVTAGLCRIGSDGRLGATLDLFLFAATRNIEFPAGRVDIFTDSGTLGDADRMKQTWELATLGTPTYTEPPREQWAITLQLLGSPLVSAGALQLEAEIV